MEPMLRTGQPVKQVRHDTESIRCNPSWTLPDSLARPHLIGRLTSLKWSATGTSQGITYASRKMNPEDRSRSSSIVASEALVSKRQP
jgi:hypothetical protein